MTRLTQDGRLPLERCPYCGIAKPLLNAVWNAMSEETGQTPSRSWRIYKCSACMNMVLTMSPGKGNEPISEIWPPPEVVDENIPDRAREYLTQAIESLSAAAGSVMLAASSIDSMLKAKGYTEGKLYTRINKAKDDHLITDEMAAWAHEIRLDANDQRHADDSAALPTRDDAIKVIKFAQALGEFLFVLPARVARGRSTN